MRSTNFVAPLFAKRRSTTIRTNILNRLSTKFENKSVIFNNRHLFTSVNKVWLSLYKCSRSKQSLNNFCWHLYRIPHPLKLLRIYVPKLTVTQQIFVGICSKVQSHSTNLCIHLYRSLQSLNYFFWTSIPKPTITLNKFVWASVPKLPLAKKECKKKKNYVYAIEKNMDFTALIFRQRRNIRRYFRKISYIEF